MSVLRLFYLVVHHDIVSIRIMFLTLSTNSAILHFHIQNVFNDYEKHGVTGSVFWETLLEYIYIFTWGFWYTMLLK